MNTVYRKIGALVTNRGVPAKRGRKIEREDLGIIENAALVFSPRKGVLWVGPDKSLPKEFRREKKQKDASGFVALPGLVDCHTHPAFGGDRAHEFSLRMAGSTYLEIAAAGGGILSTVTATRKLSEKALEVILVERFRTAKNFGVRLLEAKSGYGLTKKDEIKSLRAIASAAKKVPGLEVVRTCLAAHAVPPEFKGRSGDWVESICREILPTVAKEKLADFVDVFCDKGYFTIEETKKILRHAQDLGIATRIHGDELADTGASQMAVELGARSVDHCLKVSPAGIRALAQSETVAVLLPGTALYLREPPAPARDLIDAGAIVALASDFNPGTCPTQNLPLIASLGAIQLRMTVPEIVAALTWNAALSLGKEKDYGCLEVGFLGEPTFVEGADPAALCYRLAPAQIAPDLPKF